VPDGGRLGIDLGITNLATDSAGERFTGKIVHLVGSRYHLRRQGLEKVGTKSAKRRIPRTGRREAHLQRATNQVVSKNLVQNAVVARKAIAPEDLSGIRERTTARRAHGYERHSWAFFQLRQYIAYKAAQVGVPIYCQSIW